MSFKARTRSALSEPFDAPVEGSGSPAGLFQDHLSAAASGLLPYLIAPRGVPDPALLGDVLELRMMTLAWVAETATRRCRPQDIAHLQHQLDRLERGQGDLQTLDLDWFLELTRVTGNQVAVTLATAFKDVILANRGLFAPMYAGRWFDTTPHRRLLAAMEAGDARAAGEAMRDYGRRAWVNLGLGYPERNGDD